MHSLAVVLIPFYHEIGLTRSVAAREAAARAKIEILMLRYEQPVDQAWGVDEAQFTCDWWEVGGRWNGWGRSVRSLMKKQKVRPTRASIPRSLQPNAVWSDDFAQLRLGSFPLWPLAVVTPYGDWISAPSSVFSTSKHRQRTAKAAWFGKIQKIMDACPGCLVVAVDYHS